MTQIKKDKRVYKILDVAPKRARTETGQLKGDDASTPDINEAWEGGVAPKPKKKPKKS